jgi:hypothetical protein
MNEDIGMIGKGIEGKRRTEEEKRRIDQKIE